MNDLYGQTCSCCHSVHPRNEASVSASFTPELMARLLADIYAKTFNVEEDIYPELYEAARDTFERALQEGYPIEDVDDADTLFRQALKDDADVFAAFRTHRMQNDIASQLLDENGKLKEFRRFQEDAESVIGTYNNHWLRTEYDTAVLRARYAADWKRFSRNADILPNLKWMPTTSADPDVFHMEYWRIGLTLPKTHPFWKNHHPHDRWGCKCDLEETDDPVTGSIPEVDYRPSPGLENNPGLEPELFSHTHPYYEKAYPGAEKAVERLMAEKGNVTPPASNTYRETLVGKVYTSPYHGENEVEENERLARFIAERMENVKIWLLPRLDPDNKVESELRDTLLPPGVMERKNPDYYINGRLFDAKSMMDVNLTADPGKQKRLIENRIKKAKEQADNIVLEIPDWISRDTIGQTIANYLNRSKSRRIILVCWKDIVMKFAN